MTQPPTSRDAGAAYRAVNVGRWAALRDAIAGTLLRPGDIGFDAARARPYVAGHGEPVPAAVLRCASTQDVAVAIRFARQHDLPFAVRSGGHCSAGLSSTIGLLLDLSAMDLVEMDGKRTVVGAGVRLAGLVAALAERGRALPAGTCPTVGVAGLTLGGGWGILGRMYGLTCDQLVQAEVVTADGHVLAIDENREPDLFWALRGGGIGGFGVVTSMIFQTVAAPRMTSFQYRWPTAAAPEVIGAWLGWAIDVSDRMCAELGVSADVVNLHGAMAGAEAETVALLNQFCRELPPARTDVAELSYPDTARYHAKRLGELDPAVHLYSTSEFFEQALPEQAIGTLLERFAAGSPVREMGFMPWGGAYGAVPATATAFPHRQARYLIHHIAATPDPSVTASTWVRQMRDTVHQYGTGGVFANFADAGLDNWEHAYYGDNASRLHEVKHRYDPDNIFRSAQSLSPPST